PILPVFLDVPAGVRVIGSDPLRLAPIKELRQQRDRTVGCIGCVGHFAMEVDHVRARQFGKLPLGPARKQMKFCNASIFLGGTLLALGIDMVLKKSLEDLTETVTRFG